MRRLIINADDFGLTAGINRAVIQAHEAGVVTSATLMAGGARFGEAAQFARTATKLSIGCHVVLLDGTALRNDVPSLMSSEKSNGNNLRTGLYSFAIGALASRIDPQHVEAETIDQIRKLQSAGIAVSHLDTHKHTHVFPPVLKAVLRAAYACGVPAIRNPFSPRRGWLKQVRYTPSLLKRFLQMQILSASFFASFRKEVQHAGLTSPDGCLGVMETGSLDARLLRGIVEAMPEGTWELVCHPGYDDAELASLHTRLRASRVREMELLTAPDTRKLLAQHGVELISYNDFTARIPG